MSRMTGRTAGCAALLRDRHACVQSFLACAGPALIRRHRACVGGPTSDMQDNVATARSIAANDANKVICHARLVAAQGIL